jgi:hypothetical protein
MKNETKQTAVEWLASELSNHLEMPHKYFIEILEQAKEMEKEEHSNTWDDSVDNYKKRGGNDMRHWADFDEYYNEKFGGNNE